MKQFIFTCLVFTFSNAMAQRNITARCLPQAGSHAVCDSVKKIHHRDALHAAYLTLQDPASPYYDSIYIPQELIDRYEKALAAVYNWLPDSLNDLRYRSACCYRSEKKPWEEFTFHPPTTRKKSKPVKSDTADVLAVFRPDSVVVNRFGWLEAWHKRPVNAEAIRRRIASTGWGLSAFYSNLPSWAPPALQLFPHTRGVEMVFSVSYDKCMEPELPCIYTVRKFLVQDDGSIQYLSYKRGR